MALKLAFNTPFGFVLPEAYAKIDDFTGTKTVVSYRVTVYADQNARDNTLQAVYTTRYECLTPSGDLLPALYADLKTYEMFANATDC